eukprot:1185796-Rhodomonas_salina.1
MQGQQEEQDQEEEREQQQHKDQHQRQQEEDSQGREHAASHPDARTYSSVNHANPRQDTQTPTLPPRNAQPLRHPNRRLTQLGPNETQPEPTDPPPLATPSQTPVSRAPLLLTFSGTPASSQSSAGSVPCSVTQPDPEATVVVEMRPQPTLQEWRAQEGTAGLEGYYCHLP